MYEKILTPLDLAHVDRLAKAVNTAIDSARHCDATLVFVGVTEAAPSPMAHKKEYARKDAAYAEKQGRANGVCAAAKAYTAHDRAAQIDGALRKAVEETDADLVVMASHEPTIGDALVPSHGGRLAAHATVSVFLVR